MNRVLAWPQTRIVPGLLRPLKSGRAETVVTDRCTVRFELPLGAVEMGFLSKEQELPPGTKVHVRFAPERCRGLIQWPAKEEQRCSN